MCLFFLLCVTEGLVKKVSLNSSPREWATEVIKLRRTPRTDRIGEIKVAGYDISDAARKLERFYLNKYAEK